MQLKLLYMHLYACISSIPRPGVVLSLPLPFSRLSRFILLVVAWEGVPQNYHLESTSVHAGGFPFLGLLPKFRLS